VPTTTAAPISGTRISFGPVTFTLPTGWAQQSTGDNYLCAAPPMNVPPGDIVGLDCHGVVFLSNPDHPGPVLPAFQPDQPGDWYAATDVQPCPDHAYSASALLNGVVVGTAPPLERGLQPVGDHRANYDKWLATCESGYQFYPQTWWLPVTHLLIKDYMSHPETPGILASVSFGG